MYHLSFFTTNTQDSVDTADSSSMQDARHNELSKYDLRSSPLVSSSLGIRVVE